MEQGDDRQSRRTAAAERKQQQRRQREQQKAERRAAAAAAQSEAQADVEAEVSSEEDCDCRPPMLEVRPSPIPNAGEGLFLSSRFVAAGTVLLEEEAVVIKRPEAKRIKNLPEWRDRAAINLDPWTTGLYSLMWCLRSLI